MKAHLFCFALCLITGLLSAQTSSTPKNDLELHRITGASFIPSTHKIPCDATNSLSITSCEGETPANGDNDPSDGAFMNWTVTGGSLYYVLIYTVLDTFEVFSPDYFGLTDRTVFEPNQGDGTTLNGGIITAVEGTYDCIPQGIYTVRIWSVQDTDLDRLPDRDGAGNIIGCYDECTYDFRPSCARANEFFLTVDPRNIGCSGRGGSIEIAAFRTDNFYCVDPDGLGATIRWTGPNGFTSNQIRIENLEPGVYTAEVTDFYDCFTEWSTDIMVLDNVALACRVLATPSQVGGANGQAAIEITSGLGNYVLSWTGPVSGTTNTAINGINIIGNLPAGNYVFSLFDTRSSCTEDCQLSIPEVDCDSPIAEVIEQRNSDCDGNSNGRIELDFSGGFNPVLTWTGPGIDGSSARLLENMGPGTYRYEVTDDRLCTASGTVTITAEPSFTFNCGGVDETLPFLDDGKIGIALEGGSPAFTLTYVAITSAGDTISSLSGLIINSGDTLRNLPAANYFLEITDENGCTRTCVATVSEPDCDIFPNCVPANPQSIFGNGSVTLNFDGGANWTVTMTGPKDSTFVTSVPVVPINNLPQGDYTVSVYNSEGCLGGCTFSIVPPPCTLAAVASSRNPTCFGVSDGRIRLDITGDSEGLAVDWNVDVYDGLWVAENLPPGSYTMAVADRTECPLDTFRFELTQPAAFFVELEEVSDITCFEDTDGAIRTIIQGGVAPLRYDWSVTVPNNVTELNGLPAGNYSVLVTDASGCNDDAAITLAQPPPLSMECRATAESLMSSMDGTISVANAGAGNVVRLSGDLGTFVLSANADTTFTNLSPGSYDLVITDENGCSTDCRAIVNPGPCMISLTTTTVQPDCDNALGSATAIPADSFGTTTYNWSNGGSQATLDSLLPGQYRVTVTDASGCQATASALIRAFTDTPAVIGATASQVCDDGCTSLQLIVVGTPPFTINYGFRQGAGTEQFQNIVRSASGVETICPADLGFTSLADVTLRLVDITDGNGCTRPVNRTLPITRYAPAIGAVDTILCMGQRLNLFGEVFDESRPAGQLVLPLASVNGCDSTLLVSVSYFAPAVSALDTLLCSGEQLFFFGQTFNANRRFGAVVVPTPAVNGCDSTVMVSVQFFPPTLGRLDTTLCSGARFTYFGQVFTPGRPSGLVVVPTPAANGCDSTVRVSVRYFEPALGSLDTLICTDTRLNYYGNFFDRNRRTGQVRIPIPSVNGCDSVVTVTLGFYPEIIGVFDTTICEGDVLQYGDVLFDVAAANVLVLFDEPNSVGCDSLVLTTVRMRPIPRVQLSGDGVICPGGAVDLQLIYTGTEPATVYLSTDPTEPIDVFSGRTSLERQLLAGTVISIVDVTGGGVCPAVGAGEVVVVESDLDVGIEIQSINGDFDLECANVTDGQLLAVVTGGIGPFRYNWGGGQTSAVRRNLPVGDYRVEVISARGCVSSDVVTLTAPPPLVTDLTERLPNCLDSLPAIRLDSVSGGVGPYLFRTGVDGGFLSIDQLPLDIDLPLGRSGLEIEDANGCRVVRAFNFGPLLPEEIVVAPRFSVIPEGDSVYIQVSTTLQPIGYRLSPGLEDLRAPVDFFVGPTKRTLYTLTAVDSAGCEAATTFEVIVDDFVPIYAPNVFSPNGDGNNDVFRLYARRTVLAFNSFEVFSRWGEKVYQLEAPVNSQDTNWGWNGLTSAGKVYEQHVYVFHAEVVLSGGRVVTISGDVLLMR
jgi:gliding motility-associated-like protein